MPPEVDNVVGEPIAEGDSTLNNVPRSKTISSDTSTGQIFFAKGQKGDGYSVWNSWTYHDMSLQPACNLALGITELCVQYGYGKLCFVSNDFSGFETITNAVSYPHTKAYHKIPELIYVHYKWDAESRKTWYTSSHMQRLQQLSARGNAIPLDIPVMPIALAFEKDNYDNIRLFESDATFALAYNLCGYLYLAWYTDITALGSYHQSTRPDRLSFWQIEKTNQVEVFRMHSGTGVAVRLREMFQERRAESILLYRNVVTKLIAAHKEWAANGGYSAENDKTIPADVYQKFIEVSQARAGITAPIQRPGQRLRQLLAAHDDEWSDGKRAALEGYRTAAVEGVTSVSLYMLDDEDWTQLSKEDQRSIVELWALEQETAQRAASMIGEVAESEAGGA